MTGAGAAGTAGDKNLHHSKSASVGHILFLPLGAALRADPRDFSHCLHGLWFAIGDDKRGIAQFVRLAKTALGAFAEIEWR